MTNDKVKTTITVDSDMCRVLREKGINPSESCNNWLRFVTLEKTTGRNTETLKDMRSKILVCDIKMRAITADISTKERVMSGAKLEISTIKNNAELKGNELKKQHREALQSHTERHKQREQDNTKLRETEEQSMTKQHKDEAQAMTKQHKDEAQAMTKQYKDEAQAMKIQHEAEEQTMRKQHETQEQIITKEHSEKEQELKDRHNKEQQSWRVKCAEETSTILKEQNDERLSLEKDRESTLTEHHKQTLEAIENIRKRDIDDKNAVRRMKNELLSLEKQKRMIEEYTYLKLDKDNLLMKARERYMIRKTEEDAIAKESEGIANTRERYESDKDWEFRKESNKGILEVRMGYIVEEHTKAVEIISGEYDPKLEELLRCYRVECKNTP